MEKRSEYLKALSFAVENYDGLTRDNENIPYIVHPLRVTSLLRSVGFIEPKNNTILISALFHDLIEDTNITADVIEEEFGGEISSIVQELTIPKDGNKEEFLKNMTQGSVEARTIKMADRIDNLIDMETINWSLKKKRSYISHAKIILSACNSANEELAELLGEIIITEEKRLDRLLI